MLIFTCCSRLLYLGEQQRPLLKEHYRNVAMWLQTHGILSQNAAGKDRNMDLNCFLFATINTWQLVKVVQNSVLTLSVNNCNAYQ